MQKNMLSARDAVDYLLQAASPITEYESIPVALAHRRVLAEDIVSPIDVPSFDNSQMDGYAVNYADCIAARDSAGGAPASLPVSQVIIAGSAPQVLQAGTAARIFTGAYLPEGADTVVMQEQCLMEEKRVALLQFPEQGSFIRRCGEDIARGATILSAGRRLRAQELGLMASIGLSQVKVSRKLKVGLFFTGNELTMPGEPLKPGGIYNSNRDTLLGLLDGLGCDVEDLGIVPDNLAATREKIRAAAAQNDLIISSGGVSVGDEDHVRPALEAEGRLNVWQLAIKPGKPLAFGEVGRAFFLGLPGNPVSTFVTFVLFVRPFILHLAGVQDVKPQSYLLRADFDWTKADKRNEFLRARINRDGGLDVFPNQNSGVLTSTVWGDGLVDVAPLQTFRRGEIVRFIPFSELS